MDLVFVLLLLRAGAAVAQTSNGVMYANGSAPTATLVNATQTANALLYATTVDISVEGMLPYLRCGLSCSQQNPRHVGSVRWPR